MRALYAIRVAAISLEALLLFASILGWLAFESELMGLAKAVALNDELLKYLLVLPLGLGAWIFNEARMLLQEDKETTRVLTAWPDYWRLKTHIWIALSYALLFALLSIAPWTFKAGISTAGGLLAFLTGILGQFVVAASVYVARLRFKELIAHAGAPP